MAFAVFIFFLINSFLSCRLVPPGKICLPLGHLLRSGIYTGGQKPPEPSLLQAEQSQLS